MQIIQVCKDDLNKQLSDEACKCQQLAEQCGVMDEEISHMRREIESLTDELLRLQQYQQSVSELHDDPDKLIMQIEQLDHCFRQMDEPSRFLLQQMKHCAYG